MNQSIFSRMELHFWNFVINTLSQSTFTQNFLRKAYQLSSRSEAASLGILMGISGVIGLISGYLFYFLTLHIR